VAGPVKIHVTPELIDRATYRDSRHCVVAEALQLARPHFKNILVDLQTIRWTNLRTRKRYICLTPEIVGRALVDFDQGNLIHPFSVALDPIQVTELKRVNNADGSTGTQPRTRKRTLRLKSNGQPIVYGGKPLPSGHLRGGGNVTKNAAASDEPPETASNVVKSSRRYRRYGLRLLKD
jgi:hypothetical protein